MATGSLEVYLEVVGDLAEADALVVTEALEATEQEPPAIDANAKAGAGVGVLPY